MSGDVVELCACDRCAKPVTYDLVVPDEVWARISPKAVEGWKGGGVLCPECILSSLITSQAAEIERLTKERDAAEDAENQAKDAFWAIYHDYLERGGSPVSTEAARTALATRAETAERLLAEARAKVVSLPVHTRDDPDDAYGVNSVDYIPRKEALAILSTLTNGGENGR